MNVVITGGAGFLGQRLAKALIERGTLAGPDGHPQYDRSPDARRRCGRAARRRLAGRVDRRGRRGSRAPGSCHRPRDQLGVPSGGDRQRPGGSRLRSRDAGQLRCDTGAARGVPRPRASAASGLREQLCGLRRRAAATWSPASTALTPQSSYGSQKAMGELLVNDYSRRGFVDGRALRLPTISVRPGKPNAALSSFASGVIREPLNGVESVCPVPAATQVWLLSPATVIECFIKAHDLDGARARREPQPDPAGFHRQCRRDGGRARTRRRPRRSRLASASSPTNASNGSSAPGPWRSTPRARSASASPPTPASTRSSGATWGMRGLEVHEGS